ncbi:hypothetical protein KCMC57_up56030 [Kitasatospora sp. CMC57]|uniref:Uncharacterized protein n=1 Tax=Kitasatospora sp. CMC57 TaxID=3231513 RepID=A0AB33K9T2_9ACTN
MTDSGSAPPDGDGAPSGGTNWTAVAAVAGAVATAVAVLAYVVPPSPQAAPAPVAVPVVSASWSPEPPPSPSPVPTPASTPTPEPEPSPTPSPSPTAKPSPSPVHSLPVPVLTLPPVRPGGCDPAYAVLNRYGKVAGTTKGSRIAAAQEARDGMMSASLDATGGVYSIITRLTQGFQELGFILTGMVGGDYNAVSEEMNGDIETLKSLCESH